MKTKQKSKKIVQRILLYIWLIIGVILSIWTASWFIYTNKSRELGEVIISVVLFAVGLKLLFVYVILSIIIGVLILLIKKLNKK